MGARPWHDHCKTPEVMAREIPRKKGATQERGADGEDRDRASDDEVGSEDHADRTSGEAPALALPDSLGVADDDPITLPPHNVDVHAIAEARLALTNQEIPGEERTQAPTDRDRPWAVAEPRAKAPSSAGSYSIIRKRGRSTKKR